MLAFKHQCPISKIIKQLLSFRMPKSGVCTATCQNKWQFKHQKSSILNAKKWCFKWQKWHLSFMKWTPGLRGPQFKSWQCQIIFSPSLSLTGRNLGHRKVLATSLVEKYLYSVFLNFFIPLIWDLLDWREWPYFILWRKRQ